MDTQFEVRYYGKFKPLEEFLRKYTGAGWKSITIFFGIFLILIAISIIGNVFGKLIPYFLLYGLVILLMAGFPYLYAWSVLKNDKTQNDGTQPETVITFGETIEMYEGMIHLTIEYRKIVKVVRLEHSYVLMLGARNGVMLFPDCFTKGTFDAFKQFLREKRPDLTVPE